jgi:hypothetical protein
MSKLGTRAELSLAFSLYSGPGTYAILLGSGVSRAAGVPTGWEVTLDLVRKLAVVQGEAADDPWMWYKERFDREPSYSEVVNELAPTQDERGLLLQSYFEPDEEDREEGRKEPTAAHRAIARLCSKGCVRVLITTNFDKLLERALETEGIFPIVIDTPHAVDGAPPLQHSGCTIVKVNGDYLDTRIKNTPEELSEYDPRVEALLERIFGEYGLVVCGWSGTYDTALIDALKRSGGRRYMAYWISRGEPSEAERSLTSFIGGTSIEAGGADEFFASLLEKVEALETFGGDDPLSTPIAVATTKRYLDDPERYVRLRELVSSIGRETREKLFGEGQFPLNWGLETGQISVGREPLVEEMRRRVISYERICEPAIGVMSAGGYYAREHQHRAFGEMLELVGSPPDQVGYVLPQLRDLQVFPALLLLYAGGVAATATGNFPFLRALLRDATFTDRLEGTSPVALKVHPWVIDGHDDISAALFPGRSTYEPTSQRLFETLREPLGEYLPLNVGYQKAFDSFETLRALTFVDINKKREPDGHGWVPLGHFAVLHRRGRPEESALRALRAEYQEQLGRWGPLESGLLELPATNWDSADTVDHHFDIVDSMISRMSYF